MPEVKRIKHFKLPTGKMMPPGGEVLDNLQNVPKVSA